MRSHWRVFLILTLFSWLAACTTPGSTLSPLLQPTSPLDVPIASPSARRIVPFRLNKPIFAGVDRVSGTGPAGVPIIIADVTFMGEPLGASVIGDDGTFEIRVPVLEKNHRIGIMLGDLRGTKWRVEDFYALEYRGEDPQQVPQVGFFYDTAMVQEE